MRTNQSRTKAVGMRTIHLPNTLRARLYKKLMPYGRLKSVSPP